MREISKRMELFIGNSDMAARMRAFDWASTPLGEPASWAQSLRTAVAICLAARRPMQLWWGPELVVLYNDATIRALGDRHPHALGRPARELWGERWAEIRPTVDAALAGDIVSTGVYTFAPLDGGVSIETADAPHTDPPRERPARGTRLLVVDDNDDHARSLKAALEGLGFIVALAHDAPIALSLARTFEPDLALVDLGLPVMDGYELARRLRTAVEVPIVAVTARALDSDRERSEAEGFAAHIVKPIDLDRLVEIITGSASNQRA